MLFAQQQQRNLPHIGYVFPAGVQRGTSCELVIGGQFLQGARDVLVSGSGVTVSEVNFRKPLAMKRANDLRNYLQEARKKLMESKDRTPAALAGLDTNEMITKILKDSGATDEEIRGYLEMRQQRADPKRQPNTQIAETVTCKVEISLDAETGPHEVRVLAPNGASNPVSFCIGQLPEAKVSGTLGKTFDTAGRVTLPTVLNGQILPGTIDHYSFEARKGARVVVAMQARDLIPYLADAVPGWFQPVVVLYDSTGKEIAYANDYRFSPDPVFCCEIPENGVYVLEIKDALYRGREDFVYRVTVGEIPFVTGIFPLGGKTEASTTVDVWGWNLPRNKAIIKPSSEDGVHPVSDLRNGVVIGEISFASSSLPEVMEKEPNNDPKAAQRVKLPVIVNGHIDSPGDVDVFVFSCKAGEKVVAEVVARRLNSPLDSWIKVTDETGYQVAFNDDMDDKGAALLTHQADSYLTFTAPATGDYYIYLGNAQHKGGSEYGYRLRISPPQPDYALRVVPSSLNARPGGVCAVTLYALRKDGFSGDINLKLKDAPEGYSLQGGCIPAGQDSVRATLIMSPRLGDAPVSLTLEGRATVNGKEMVHPVVPADDMLQAFAYHHLVPANELLAVKSANASSGRSNVNNVEPLQLPVGAVGHLSFPIAVSQGSNQPGLILELSEPPEGISIERVMQTREGVTLTVRASSKMKPGTRGNLIFEVFSERPLPAPAGKKPEMRRYTSGYLPAIPFTVTAR